MECKCGNKMHLEEYEDMYNSEYYYFICEKCDRSIGMTIFAGGDVSYEWSDE